jgi:hypothetical protein
MPEQGVQGVPLTVEHNQKSYQFILRSNEYTALDELWIESRIPVYLHLVGANPLTSTDPMMKKARTIATAELIIIDMKPILYPDNLMMSIGSLPPEVINKLLDTYFGQFKGQVSDPKKS